MCARGFGVRVDPLLLASIAGLAGAGLVATLHPVEPFDAAQWESQLGRTVDARLLVLESDTTRDWWRGRALALDEGGVAQPGTVAWTWFAPGAVAPMAGDTMLARSSVERRDGAVALLLDGAGAARIEAPDGPPKISWEAMLEAPTRWQERSVALAGSLSNGALESPDAAHRCVLVEGPAAAQPSSSVVWWTLKLQPAPNEPAWHCRLVRDASDA